jgi:hypothetical protein
MNHKGFFVRTKTPLQEISKIFISEMNNTLKNHFKENEYRELEIGETFNVDDVCYHKGVDKISICNEDSLQVEEEYVYDYMHKPFFRKNTI